MPFNFIDLGLIDYARAWSTQKQVHTDIRNYNTKSTLIFCRHYPVITMGKSACAGNILANAIELSLRGISIFKIERGGDVTYHGPGQLTAYPIFDLKEYKKDLGWYLRQLEETVIICLREMKINADRKAGLTGVWVGGRKISSIGISVKNWISFHGLALNVKRSDLANFRLIKPCGMDVEMTAVEEVLDKRVKIDNIKENLFKSFRTVFY